MKGVLDGFAAPACPEMNDLKLGILEPNCIHKAWEYWKKKKEEHF